MDGEDTEKFPSPSLLLLHMGSNDGVMKFQRHIKWHNGSHGSLENTEWHEYYTHSTTQFTALGQEAISYFRPMPAYLSLSFGLRHFLKFVFLLGH